MILKVQKFKMYAWLAFGILTAILILIYGAWHHIITVGLCTAMFFAYKSDVEELERAQKADAGKVVRNNTHTH